LHNEQVELEHIHSEQMLQAIRAHAGSALHPVLVRVDDVEELQSLFVHELLRLLGRGTFRGQPVQLCHEVDAASKRMNSNQLARKLARGTARWRMMYDYEIELPEVRSQNIIQNHGDIEPIGGRL